MGVACDFFHKPVQFRAVYDRLEDDVERPARERPGLAAEAGRYLGVGMTSALSTGLFLWLGMLVDGRWQTEPIFALIGAFVGAAAGFYYMYHHLVTVPQREQKQRADRSGKDAGETPQ